jgi:vacuolar protein sorting-associated protein 54
MELLVKETVTLHKVLSRYLSVTIVKVRMYHMRHELLCPKILMRTNSQDVMTQVFAAINHRLSEEYGKIELPNPEAKTRCVLKCHETNEDIDGC